MLRDVSCPQKLWHFCQVPCGVFWWRERAADKFLDSLSRRQEVGCLWSLLARWSPLYTMAFLFKSIREDSNTFPWLHARAGWTRTRRVAARCILFDSFDLAFSSAKRASSCVLVSRGSLWRRVRLLPVPWVGFFWVWVGVGGCVWFWLRVSSIPSVWSLPVASSELPASNSILKCSETEWFSFTERVFRRFSPRFICSVVRNVPSEVCPVLGSVQL